MNNNSLEHRFDTDEINSFCKYITEDLGYDVIKIEQQWRHITGRIMSKDGHLYFIKMATTPDIGIRTRTEFEWQQIRDSLGIQLPIKIPRIIAAGMYKGKLYWHISEYIDGPLLADSTHPESVDDLIQYLPQIVQTIKAISDIKSDKQLPRDKEFEGSIEEVLMKEIQKWSPDISVDISELVEFMLSRIKYVKRGACHGDFVPWHIIKSNTDGMLYLIDNESTALHRLFLYDLAYMYHRIYTKLKNPYVARLLLDTYEKLYGFTSEDREGFLAILALRAIGGYKDCNADIGIIGGADETMQSHFVSDLLHGRIF